MTSCSAASFASRAALTCVAAEHSAQQRLEASPARQAQLVGPDGEVLLEGLSTRVPGGPEAGLQLRIEAAGNDAFNVRVAQGLKTEIWGDAAGVTVGAL